MKNLFLVSALLFLVSCNEKASKSDSNYPAGTEPEVNIVEQGKVLFEGRGNCTACHKEDQKVIGPSIREMAQVYKTEKADMQAFLRGETPAIIDPEKYEIMKVNLEITKAMTDEERAALEAYIYSFAP
ncbi:c-type cytochrome [Flavobacterium sp.]|uniref:c-type cytochrome n=1 Tax=Flavobacterium sp. TaxID=239 RepID=UPI003B9D2F37